MCIDCAYNLHIIMYFGNRWPVFSYKLRYIVGFALVEMAISTNAKPTIYRNLYENTGHEQLEPVSIIRHPSG